MQTPEGSSVMGGCSLSPSLGLAEGSFTGGKAILCSLDTLGPT